MKPPDWLNIAPRPRWWCLTHDCWDGDCGVLGQHEVEPRHAVRPKRMVLSTEWARWPWETCKAVTYDEYGTCRCDLKKRHGGHHRAERGMYDVVWSSIPFKAERAHG